MTTPDRAAKVAERVHKRTCADHSCRNGSKRGNFCKLLISDNAAAIRREVKRAVEEEREACAEIAFNYKLTGRGSVEANLPAGEIAAAIRARGKR